MRVGCLFACVLAALVLGCSGGAGSGSSRSAHSGDWGTEPSNSTTSPEPARAPDLRIFAGSELKELEPDIVSAAHVAGVTIGLTYVGTLEMVDRANAGEPVDALLPPNGAYPSLALAHKPVAKEKLFYSRVALGVKESKARELGWDHGSPSWSDVTQAVRDGKFVYAMTNPTSSNTGMSTLFAVAASSAKKTEDLSVSEVDRAALKDFLAGQKLTAGSSGWLSEAYVAEQDRLDGLVNYEAVLLRLNEQPELHEKLTLIYPRDGVISADYPLLLLDPRKKAVYDRLVAALKAPGFQANALQRAYLRPSDPTARHSPRLSDSVVAELSFPNNLEVIDSVLSAYQAELRRPATSIYLLDVSGSMRGPRLAAVKHALELLTGLDERGAASRYARFQNREHVMLIPFAGSPWKAMRFNFENQAQKAQTEGQLRDFVDNLRAGGGTAIYSTLDLAYDLAYQELARYPGRVVTVVLLTDGRSNNGLPYEEFRQRWSGKNAGGGDPIRTFPILFGEASSAELDEIARLSGGRSFDGRSADLRDVFREIRGYQ
ncbi:MAG TPA: substrate-binding domain-containing protein [Steroidobacteraceae bacterium]